MEEHGERSPCAGDRVHGERQGRQAESCSGVQDERRPVGDTGNCQPRYPGGSSDVLADDVNVKFTEHMPSVNKDKERCVIRTRFFGGWGSSSKNNNNPSTDEWIKKMRYIQTMEYYSAIRKNKIMPFAATWMDLEGVMLSGMSDRERQILYDITYM